jgi:hypothetical protein
MADTASSTLQEGMLQLKVEVPEEGLTDPGLFVRWCVTKELTELVARHGAVKPYALISVRPYTVVREGNEDIRKYSRVSKQYIVPLTEEMQLVSFSRKGLNAISATIVWDDQERGRVHLGRVFRDGKVFDTYDGQLQQLRDHSRGDRAGHLLYEVFDELTFDVPDDAFPQDEPEWLRLYYRKFSAKSSFDECQTRRRYAWLPLGLVVFPIAYLVRLVLVLIGWALGLRNLHYQGFAHPLRDSAEDVVKHCGKSIWWFDDQGDQHPIWRQALNPVTPVALALVLFVISSWHITRGDEVERIEPLIGWGWWQTLGISVALHLVPLVAMAIFGAVIFLGGTVAGISSFKSLHTRVTQRGQRRRTEREQNRKRNREQRLSSTRRALDEMTCTTEAQRVSVDALPPKKQTIWLKMQKHKSESCRSYAR